MQTTVSDVQRLLAEYGFSFKRTEAVATQLRAAGMLPIGGRGPNAPKITPEVVALFVLAVAGSSQIRTSGSVANRINCLVGRNGTNLVSSLADVLRNIHKAMRIRHVIVMHDGRVAETTTIFPLDIEQFHYPKTSDFVRVSSTGHAGVLDGSFLLTLAERFYAKETTDA